MNRSSRNDRLSVYLDPDQPMVANCMPAPLDCRPASTTPHRNLSHGWIFLGNNNGATKIDTRKSALGQPAYCSGGLEFLPFSGATRVAIKGPYLVALVASPHAVRPTDGIRPVEDIGRDPVELVLEHWIRGSHNLASLVRGRFAIIALNSERGAAYLATDRFGSIPIYYAAEGIRFAFAQRADEVPLQSPPAIDPQALLRYVYFHCLPAPETVFQGVRRLRAAEEVIADRDGIRVRAYWTPEFREERRPFPERKEEFLGLLRSAVRREVEGGGTLGTFLSGGTDSSTVTGLLREATGQPVRAYSIGFEAQGYDEMEYARIAARHFGADHRSYYVTPDDIARSLPDIATWFDQPFGNSSALPGYYCARLARSEGIDRILAGDGGDELFGGNSRYAKQKVFDIYGRVPGFLRAGVLEPLLVANPAAAHIPLVKKTRSYIQQAKVPMPARMETYNLLDRIGPENLFTSEFLRQVDLGGPAGEQAETYARVSDGSLVNRMLAYDWQYTLADSDLPKVCGTTAMAGLDVGFPMLDDDLLDFSLRLTSEDKVNGLALRYFFKEALRGFLPDEILRKQKHGFGLPFGVWLTQHKGLQTVIGDAFGSLGERGFLQPPYLKEIHRQVLSHPGYYGELVWILATLEHWLRKHAPEYRID